MQKMAEWDDTVRVQFYHMDMGMYRKSWIQHISKEEYGRLMHNGMGHGTVAVKLGPGNWHGEKLPDILRQ